MEKSNNPFRNDTKDVMTTHPETSHALVSVASEREVAEVKAAMILARQFPRDPLKAMDEILVSCQRVSLAERATYEYNRGGTDITGPSIRLAEAIAQAWGNIQFGIRELEQRNGESTVESYAWELEKNIRQSKVFQVLHKRFTKKGTYALSDPRDIYELTANQGARRLRACILGIIPGDVVETAVSECEKTMRTSVAITPESIKTMLDKFAEYGVTQPQIEKRIQRRIDTIQPAQFVGLRKIYNSLKDGMSTPADWFEMAPEGGEPAEPKSGAEAAKEAIKRKRTPKAEPVQESPSVQEQPPEPLVDDSIPQPTKFLYCQEREQRIPAGLPACKECETQCAEYVEWLKTQAA